MYHQCELLRTNLLLFDLEPSVFVKIRDEISFEELGTRNEMRLTLDINLRKIKCQKMIILSEKFKNYFSRNHEKMTKQIIIKEIC